MTLTHTLQLLTKRLQADKSLMYDPDFQELWGAACLDLRLVFYSLKPHGLGGTQQKGNLWGLKQHVDAFPQLLSYWCRSKRGPDFNVVFYDLKRVGAILEHELTHNTFVPFPNTLRYLRQGSLVDKATGGRWYTTFEESDYVAN